MAGSRRHHQQTAWRAAGRTIARAVERRRTFAFICMVFGMFMAILDIQIVSASLAEIQAGLSASADEISWVQTSYLIAEVIMIPLSGTLSRVLVDALDVRDLRRRVHDHERHVRDLHVDRADDRLARAAGLYRRRHDPDGVRVRLHDLSAFETAHDLADHRPRGDARAHHRADRRRLSDGAFLLALAVSRQHRARHFRHGHRPICLSISTSRISACSRPSTGAASSFMAVFLGSLEYVLEEGPTNDWFDDRAVVCSPSRASRPASRSSIAR